MELDHNAETSISCPIYSPDYNKNHVLFKVPIFSTYFIEHSSQFPESSEIDFSHSPIKVSIK